MKKGFTLIELAIVMVIIGLLIGGGFQTMQIMSKRAKVIETQQQLEALQEAIKGFVQVNGGLPTQAEFDTLTGTTRDSWNGVINYFHDAALEGTGTLCTATVTDLSINGDFNNSDVAFVLVSQGENYNLQTQQIAGVPDTVALYNPATKIDGQPLPTNRATDDFDDISVQMSLAELKAQIGCQPLSIINPSLHNWSLTSGAYSAQIIPQGGSGYTYALTVNPAGMTINAAGVISWAVPTVGTHAVTVRVTSGALQTTRTYVLVINP